MNPDIITLVLLIAFLLSALGVVYLGAWILRKGPKSRQQARLQRIAPPEEAQEAQARTFLILTDKEVGKLRAGLNRALGAFSSAKLQLKLSSAYWAITDTEYLLIRIIATALAFYLGWQIPGNILGGVFFGVIALLVPPIFLDRAISNRQKKFNNQMLDVLTLVQGAVQAGYSLLQALDLAVSEVPAPASEEFGRVLREIRLGLSLEAALFNLAERMENDDLQIVVTAIIINAQVGGNLSTVLEAVIGTIRARQQLMGEIRSLTAYARYVGNFLSLLPFLTGAGIFLLSRSYFDTVADSIFVQVMFGGALLGILIGNIWIRRIARIKV